MVEPSVEGTRVQDHLCHFEAWAISVTPLCPCLWEETVKAVGPFYLGSMPGELKDPMQGNEKTCGGLINSREGHS